ncbi:TRAP transporter substrate-binding protein DctP [Marivirga lumbricoides]|uniref:TRAP transporter substrate-binding protein DctP n=1 Tax=Marivirga lumbricoides TaxID=1046115 RepID=A0A2T4DTC6_9BACT|nr:TRAP transporter substrate-binding protein DctP [Marivirga lumbricoides]
MKFLKSMQILRFSFLFLLLCFSCKEEGKVKTIKLAHSLSEAHPVHQAMVFMAGEVLKNSKGRLQLEIYPGSQLGSEQQCLELLQIGSLGMTKVSAAVMENFSPSLKVFGFPYLFRNDEHRFSVYDGPIGQQLLKEGQQYWLRGLAYFDAGNRSFYTKDKQIKEPKDLEGLKIRVMQSPTAIELVKSFGGSPTPISWGELYTALQQGVVDGAENNLPSFYSSRHYEVSQFLTVNEHSSIPDILVISTIIWDDLSDDERAWLMDAVEEATIYQRKLWKKAEEEALFEVKKAGVTVYYPDKDLFETLSSGMVKQLQKTDPEMYELIKEIKNVE